MMYENVDWPSPNTRRPRQTYVDGRDEPVCVIHDYDEPDAQGMQHCCMCPAKRHKDSQI